MGSISSLDLTGRDGRAYTVRTAQPDDAEPVLAVSLAVIQEGPWSVTAAEEFTFTVEQERDYLQAHLDAPGQLALVADADGSVVGFLGVESGPRKAQEHRGVLHMAVARDWRDVGVGTALIEAALGWARGNPLLEKLSLAVLADNARAIAVYRRLGFVDEGRRPREVRRPSGEFVDDVLLYQTV